LDSIPLVRETPLVGRRQQLAQLLEAWRRMQAGRGGAVLVTGEPGIGKSRLVRELRRRVPADVWFEARCVAEQQDSPLRPIADMIAAIGEPLESMLRRRGLDPAETLPPLAAALSLPLDPRWPRPQLTPEREKELAFDNLLRLLVRRAADRPVVMAFEDVHWADPTTLELLSLIVREVGSGDLVGARLDALSPTGRATAQLAAVLGREFRGDMLRAAATEDEAILHEDLRELLDASIIYHRRSAPSESYVFRLALVRESAYESM